MQDHSRLLLLVSIVISVWAIYLEIPVSKDNVCNRYRSSSLDVLDSWK